jgi:hypothetical protein
MQNRQELQTLLCYCDAASIMVMLSEASHLICPLAIR